MASNKLRLLPLGGLGEIGMNCFVLEWGGEMVLIDCGIQFPDASYAGVELLLPDLSYVTQRIKALRGVVVTHGHDDHIGAIPYLSRFAEIDVYSTPFPRGLLQNKLAEHVGSLGVNFREIKPREKFKVGPFTFEGFPVQHSIIESLALGIETPVGTLVHTGDFKHDPRDEHGEVIGFDAFKELGDKGVRLLLSDSTNAERVGHTISEDDITHSFEKLLGGQTGRVIIALFASNIRRVESLLALAHSQGKKVAFAGRSMHSYTRLAHEQGKMNLPPDTLVLLENTAQVPDDKLIVLATGSQAEPQSALLRIAQGIHKDFEIRSGDQVILSSRFIPGNERAISSMIDHLYRLGAEVLYEAIHQIHVSGHGFQDELLMMLNATRPQAFIPIHGEYRHMSKHARLAKTAGVPPQNIKVIEDGQVVELDEETIELAEKIELSKIPLVDGVFLESDPAVFAQRVGMAKTGVVFAVLVRDPDTLRLASAPAVATHGILYRKGEDPELARRDAEQMLEDVYEDEAEHPELAELLRIELRRFFRKRASHKPVAVPVIIDLD